MYKHLQSQHFVYCCSNNKYVVVIIRVILVLWVSTRNCSSEVLTSRFLTELLSSDCAK